MSERGWHQLMARQAAERADRLQAGIFRRALRVERAALAADIAGLTKSLQRLTGAERSTESIGIHRSLRAKSAELRSLDRMIERLQHRFPAGSAG